MNKKINFIVIYDRARETCYVVTNKKVCKCGKDLQTTIKYLMANGHQPATRVEFIGNINKFNEGIEEFIYNYTVHFQKNYGSEEDSFDELLDAHYEEFGWKLINVNDEFFDIVDVNGNVLEKPIYNRYTPYLLL